MNELLSVCFQVSRDYLVGHLRSVQSVEFKRYFLLDSRAWQTLPLNLFVGPRGVGKTTSLLQLTLEALGMDIEKTDALYVPIDHFKLKEFSLYEIGEVFANYGGHLLCVDEIHKYENWAQELKSLYETFKDLKLVVSGSSILEIQKASHDLSRRALIHKVYGMSFREYLALKYRIPWLDSYDFLGLLTHHETICREIVELLGKDGIHILAEFQLYLKEGYYPYFKMFDALELFGKTLEQQVRTSIESDIPNIYTSFTGVSTKKISKLLAFIAQSVPYEPNYKKLKAALDIGDERTLKQYIKILEDSLLLQTLYKYPKGFKQVEEIGKIYLQNTNLQWALSTDIDIGTLRETFLLSMLRQMDIPVYQPAQGDFLISDSKKKIILEVGGKRKNKLQIYQQKNSYLVLDDLKVGIDQKIPLWGFGFLY